VGIDMHDWDDVDDIADAFRTDVEDEAGDEVDPGTLPDVLPERLVGGLPEAIRPTDPSELGYPQTLPVEVALMTAPEDEIRQAYGYSVEDWSNLKLHPRFQRDLDAARDMLREEGMSFRLKARLQSEELLKTSWKLIHDASGVVPPSVKADLLKFTVRAAGLEARAKDVADVVTPLQINISF